MHIWLYLCILFYYRFLGPQKDRDSREICDLYKGDPPCSVPASFNPPIRDADVKRLPSNCGSHWRTFMPSDTLLFHHEHHQPPSFITIIHNRNVLFSQAHSCKQMLSSWKPDHRCVLDYTFMLFNNWITISLSSIRCCHFCHFCKFVTFATFVPLWVTG